MKRFFDTLFSLLTLIILSPVFLLISMLIMLSSKGGIFFKQERIGKNGNPFNLFKFRTMKPGSDKLGLITVGGRDPRITGIGYFLRKYKIDELPQLFNILKGEMSFVGPRPEVKKYVDRYSEEQKKILNIKPGLTDYASIEFYNESEILAEYDDPEQAYIKEIMPKKLSLNLKYIQESGFFTDCKIMAKTILRILR